MEFSPEYRPTEEESRLEKLGFEELKDLYREVVDLVGITFQETEDGFVNAQGQGIWIHERDGLYQLRELSSNLKEIHAHLATGRYLLREGSPNKEEVLQEIRDLLASLDYRIIE